MKKSVFIMLKTIVKQLTLAVKAVSSGHAHVLMKGNLATSTILKAVLNSEYGLRTGKFFRMSQRLKFQAMTVCFLSQMRQ